MKESITVVPAYGRDYRSAAAVKAAWEENKDFEVAGIGERGSYCNKADMLQYLPDHEVWVRYDKLRKKVQVQ